MLGHLGAQVWRPQHFQKLAKAAQPVAQLHRVRHLGAQQDLAVGQRRGLLVRGQRRLEHAHCGKWLKQALQRDVPVGDAEIKCPTGDPRVQVKTVWRLDSGIQHGRLFDSVQQQLHGVAVVEQRAHQDGHRIAVHQTQRMYGIFANFQLTPASIADLHLPLAGKGEVDRLQGLRRHYRGHQRLTGGHHAHLVGPAGHPVARGLVQQPPRLREPRPQVFAGRLRQQVLQVLVRHVKSQGGVDVDTRDREHLGHPRPRPPVWPVDFVAHQRKDRGKLAQVALYAALVDVVALGAQVCLQRRGVDLARRARHVGQHRPLAKQGVGHGFRAPAQWPQVGWGRVQLPPVSPTVPCRQVVLPLDVLHAVQAACAMRQAVSRYDSEARLAIRAPPRYESPMPDVNALLRQMSESRASDLFVSEGRAPSLRVDGAVISTNHRPTERAEIEAFLAEVLSATAREQFDTTGDLDLGVTLHGAGRFRLNVHQHRGLLGLVIRRIPSGSHTFESLGLPLALRAWADQRRGILLVVGSTGSGKSTTMAALIHHINATSARHIVTLEDPIEFIHEDLKSIVTQREIGIDTRDFSTALRHVVRESPDVILIGELRDMESMQVALSAAVTGHLVIASLHTSDAIQTLQRVVGMFPEHARQQAAVDLSGSLVGIVAQRLVPRADGKGRAPAVEMLTATPAVKRLLREARLDELPDLMQSGEGMWSFNRSLVHLYERKTITLEAGAAFATNPDEFKMNAQGLERSATPYASNPDELPSVGNIDLRQLLQFAIQHGASDIHVNAGAPPIFRINGALAPLKTQSLTAGDTRKLLFGLLNTAQREEFELQRELDFAITLTGKHRCRINAHYQRGTVAMAMRLIPMQIPDLATLGLPQAVRELAERHQGLVLVTGPTGSGKSTTLASLIHLVNTTRNCHVITIEDPIEFVHANGTAIVEQREVGADTKSFAEALKFILRQDPDVILIGEMRDMETISAALTAAETGHLVFATLHTNDAPQTIDRIIDVYPPFQQAQVRTQLASCLTSVISQRLLPRADGSGRVAAFEVLMGTQAVRAVIREGKTFQLISVMETSAREGMLTMDRSLGDLVRSGQVTQDDAQRLARTAGSLRAELDRDRPQP